MPTNTAPEFKNAEARYKAARTDEERLDALEEMARTLNKHKGTEKLYADIKSRIKELKAQLETKGKHKAHSIKVDREGAGQVALVGAENAGKSSLLAALTHATPEIADYPFTTRAPIPGMMAFEDVGIQLVDLPPISTQHTESWVYGIVRNADAMLLVFDLTALDPEAEIESVRALLAEHGLPLLRAGEAAPDDLKLAPKPGFLVGTHLDVEGAAEILSLLREAHPGFEIFGVGAGGAGTEPLRRRVFDLLELMRVYSKAPGKEPDRSKPFVLRRGATVQEFAARVHKDFVEKLAFARVWGQGVGGGQRVHRDHGLADGDVVELHL